MRFLPWSLSSDGNGETGETVAQGRISEMHGVTSVYPAVLTGTE